MYINHIEKIRVGETVRIKRTRYTESDIVYKKGEVAKVVRLDERENTLALEFNKPRLGVTVVSGVAPLDVKKEWFA